MVLVIHIALAILSIGLATFTALFPSRNKLRITYFLSLGTFGSGFIMFFIHPVNLGRACASGILYLGFMVAISAMARRKLALIRTPGKYLICLTHGWQPRL